MNWSFLQFPVIFFISSGRIQSSASQLPWIARKLRKIKKRRFRNRFNLYRFDRFGKRTYVEKNWYFSSRSSLLDQSICKFQILVNGINLISGLLSLDRIYYLMKTHLVESDRIWQHSRPVQSTHKEYVYPYEWRDLVDWVNLCKRMKTQVSTTPRSTTGFSNPYQMTRLNMPYQNSEEPQKSISHRIKARKWQYSVKSLWRSNIHYSASNERWTQVHPGWASPHTQCYNII